LVLEFNVLRGSVGVDEWRESAHGKDEVSDVGYDSIVHGTTSLNVKLSCIKQLDILQEDENSHLPSALRTYYMVLDTL
jgi:hypothetical protein